MTRLNRSRARFEVEPLEGRCLLSTVRESMPHHPLKIRAETSDVAGFRLDLKPSDLRIGAETANPPRSAITPAEFARAYGIDPLPEKGQGVTIAIVDPGDDPKIAADLSSFSTAYGLPQMDGVDGDPSFSKATPQGTPKASVLDSTEISLDVEWAHAVAPMANILLVESLNTSKASLFAGSSSAEVYAMSQPGVVVASNSWAFLEYPGEVRDDSFFETPSGHAPVAVAFATGDSGEPGFYPAFSPDVIAVGGTTLFTRSNGSYSGEIGWSGSGGGLSKYEPSPAFQRDLGEANRSIPDISIDANPLTGVAIYDSFGLPGWIGVGGTSLSTPAWSGLIALTQEARLDAGLSTLDSVQINDRFYAASVSPGYSQVFHDIVLGDNGSKAGPGYDEVTGLGSPVAQGVVKLLASGSA